MQGVTAPSSEVMGTCSTLRSRCVGWPHTIMSWVALPPVMCTWLMRSSASRALDSSMPPTVEAKYPLRIRGSNTFSIHLWLNSRTGLCFTTQVMDSTKRMWRASTNASTVWFPAPSRRHKRTSVGGTRCLTSAPSTHTSTFQSASGPIVSPLA